MNEVLRFTTEQAIWLFLLGGIAGVGYFLCVCLCLGRTGPIWAQVLTGIIGPGLGLWVILTLILTNPIAGGG